MRTKQKLRRVCVRLEEDLTQAPAFFGATQIKMNKYLFLYVDLSKVPNPRMLRYSPAMSWGLVRGSPVSRWDQLQHLRVCNQP